MKYLLLFTIYTFSLFSQDLKNNIEIENIDVVEKNQQLESPISLPQTEVLKPRYLECNLSCLNNLLDNDLTFSFLAYVQDHDNKNIIDLGNTNLNGYGLVKYLAITSKGIN